MIDAVCMIDMVCMIGGDGVQGWRRSIRQPDGSSRAVPAPLRVT
jgi:hypothetical protein